jgi:hypothetical protein
MTEKQRIQNNNNGEVPDGAFDIVRALNINNPLDELNTFKQTILAILENPHLDEEDPQWNLLLPKKLVRFTDQLEEDDYHKDDLISHIPTMIYKIREIREWEWYSSKLTGTGFEIYMKGIFRGTFLPLLHHQGIPHTSMFIERNGIEYPTKALIDVMTYKSFDPISFELRKK